MRRSVAAVLAAMALAVAAVAQAQSFAPFTVKDIRVEGLQRTEPGTIFSYLPVKVGETMTEEKAQAALRALYATGFFKDVRLEMENDVLIVYVEERPAIASIDFSGMREFEPDTVRKVLREVGMAEGRIFDRALLESTELEMKRQYLSRGLCLLLGHRLADLHRQIAEDRAGLGALQPLDADVLDGEGPERLRLRRGRERERTRGEHRGTGSHSVQPVSRRFKSL